MRPLEKKKRKKDCLRYAEGSRKKKDYSKVMLPVGRRDSEVVNGDRREAERRGTEGRDKKWFMLQQI